MKHEYLMLAHKFKPGKHNIGGWFYSEKLDGMRAFWDGGVSRGLLASDVPYANTAKDARLKHTQVATGLWSRSGKTIHAPDWWLDTLPKIMLDGELFMGRGKFQSLRKIAGKHSGSEGWEDIMLLVFDSPPIQEFGRPREIKIRNDYSFLVPDCTLWLQRRGAVGAQLSWGFSKVLDYIEIQCRGRAIALKQDMLSSNHLEAVEEVNQALDNLVAGGAEGVMLRRPNSFWLPQRSHFMLKHKPFSDAEGTLVGFTSGRETDRGSRNLGKIGALILDFNGKRLELSGLTDAEREFVYEVESSHATNNPGQDMPPWFVALCFEVGQQITFKYRELSDDGIPKEARYWRGR